MTAPKPAVEITRERVEWFAKYYKANPSWGVFHVALADGNYKCGAGEPGNFSMAKFSDELRDAVRYFDKLSPSQRKRLGQRAEDLANTVVR